MSRYQYLISQMTWSFSRLRCFEDCPYRFMLTYIYPEEEIPQFFAEYGQLVHQLFADFFLGKIRKERLLTRFITGFYTKITGRQSPAIKRKFFNQGILAMQRIQQPSCEIVHVENRINFDIEGYPFTGFIDLVLRDQDGELYVIDHKSHPLKPRSQRKKPTKADKELDEYLRQLYLYAIWIEQEYGKPPKELIFHCYRTGEIIRQAFDRAAADEAKLWAVNLIHRIEAEEDFLPRIDPFACRNICGVHPSCEYIEIGG